MHVLEFRLALGVITTYLHHLLLRCVKPGCGYLANCEPRTGERSRDLVNSEPQMANLVYQSRMSVSCDCDYQCTSVSFVKLSNRIELFFPESECSSRHTYNTLALPCETIGTVGDAPANSPKSATVNQVRSSRFTYSSQQKFAFYRFASSRFANYQRPSNTAWFDILFRAYPGCSGILAVTIAVVRDEPCI